MVQSAIEVGMMWARSSPDEGGEIGVLEVLRQNGLGELIHILLNISASDRGCKPFSRP